MRFVSNSNSLYSSSAPPLLPRSAGVGSGRVIGGPPSYPFPLGGGSGGGGGGGGSGGGASGERNGGKVPLDAHGHVQVFPRSHPPPHTHPYTHAVAVTPTLALHPNLNISYWVVGSRGWW